MALLQLSALGNGKSAAVELRPGKYQVKGKYFGTGNVQVGLVKSVGWLHRKSGAIGGMVGTLVGSALAPFTAGISAAIGPGVGMLLGELVGSDAQGVFLWGNKGTGQFSVNLSVIDPDDENDKPSGLSVNTGKFYLAVATDDPGGHCMVEISEEGSVWPWVFGAAALAGAGFAVWWFFF